MRSRVLHVAGVVGTVAIVVVAAVFGGLLAVWAFSLGYRLSAGTIVISVSPFHRGSLDLYVPVVDWGVRFPGVNFPARLQVEVQAVDRTEVARLARGGIAATDALRDEAQDAITSFLKLLAVVAAAAALALGALVAAVVRPLHTVRFRWLLATAGIVAVGWLAAVALLLAPRGTLPEPEYYAHGSDIPVALRAVESVGRTSNETSASFENQIKGLARLVIRPQAQPTLAGRPHLTIASDMHNNVLLASTLRQAAAGGPLLFIGDLTDTGSPLETSALADVADAGDPFVFVGGNHDSDTAARTLARRGAIVLTQRGQLRANGRYGKVVVRVSGLRIAGYTSPNQRRGSDGYRDRGAKITEADEQKFALWLATVENRIDVLMVHEPALVAPQLERLRAQKRKTPLLIAVGHTHHTAVDSADGVTEVNGGTIGAGGTGNLTEKQEASLAIVTYRRAPFRPLAVDLVSLDPDSGGATARRVPLGTDKVQVGELDTKAPEER